MGIPGFNSRTLSCAKLHIIGKRGDRPHTQAVIDGPALAYDAFHQLRDEGRTPKSYADIKDAMFSRLNQLESHGIQISAIVFDGALPDEKLDERVTRFENSYAALDKAKSTTASRPSQYNPACGSRLGKIPPAFLVSSAYEELVGSSYGQITVMVPGEADPFVVLAAIEASESRSVIIFTSDSDLLLYKSGLTTRVVYLDTIEEVDFESTICGSLQARVFHPAAFTEELKTDDILRPAFLMEIDRQLPLKQAIDRAKDPSAIIPEKFATFVERYSLPVGFKADHSQVLVDVRLNEFIHQIEQESRDLRVFLPPLIEDVGRGTGWYLCRDLRQLSYSVLALQSRTMGVTNLAEYSRRGLLCRPDRVSFFDRRSLAIELLEWHSLILEALSIAKRGLRSTLAWRFVGLFLLYKDFERNSKTLPDVKTGLKLLTNGFTPGDWLGVHLQAQHQAVLYALRMLKQACHVVNVRGFTRTGATQLITKPVGTGDAGGSSANQAIIAAEVELGQQIQVTVALFGDLPKLSSLMGTGLLGNDSKIEGRCFKALQRLHRNLRAAKSSRLDEQETQTDKREGVKRELAKYEGDDELSSNNPFAILQRSRVS